MKNEDSTDKRVPGLTCFSAQEKYGVDCQRKKCKHWIPYSDGHNCVLITAQDGPKTLQEIGSIYNLTRMRICQIEKGLYKKISAAVIQDV